MRMSRMLATLACLGVLDGMARAGEPQEYTITVPEVEVRSGPSLTFYATGILYRGARVQVVGRANGWLSIKPPPGSFSWIDARFVKQQGCNLVVEAVDGAPIRVGSRVLNAPPSVEPPGARALQGTILTAIGQGQVDGNVTWLPILPGPREVRYVPQEAAEPPVMAQMPAPAVPIAVPASFALPRPAAPAGSDLGVASRPQQPPPSFPDSSPANPMPENRSATSSNELHAELASYASSRRPAPPSNSAPDPAAVRRTPPPAPSSPPSSPYGSAQWFQLGYLQQSTLTERDGRPIYRLEPAVKQDPHGEDRWAYVTAAPNVNLEPYVGKAVQLYGTMTYRPDLHRQNHILVMAVSPNP